MQRQTIERRVEMLEEHVMSLQQLPARMDAMSLQISQLREDLGARISATEERILVQVRMLHEDVVARLALIQEGQPRPRRRRI